MPALKYRFPAPGVIFLCALMLPGTAMGQSAKEPGKAPLVCCEVKGRTGLATDRECRKERQGRVVPDSRCRKVELPDLQIKAPPPPAREEEVTLDRRLVVKDPPRGRTGGQKNGQAGPSRLTEPSASGRDALSEPRTGGMPGRGLPVCCRAVRDPVSYPSFFFATARDCRNRHRGTEVDPVRCRRVCCHLPDRSGPVMLEPPACRGAGGRQLEAGWCEADPVCCRTGHVVRVGSRSACRSARGEIVPRTVCDGSLKFNPR